MKAVIIGEGSGASREAVMAVYSRHKVVVDAFKARSMSKSPKRRSERERAWIEALQRRMK